jgi:hypothetical protein
MFPVCTLDIVCVGRTITALFRITKLASSRKQGAPHTCLRLSLPEEGCKIDLARVSGQINDLSRSEARGGRLVRLTDVSELLVLRAVIG